MTHEQTAILARYFQRCGSPSTEWNQSLHLYFRRASQLDTCKDVAREDDRAAQQIAELEQMLEALHAHRGELAERYAELAIAPRIPVIRLTRVRTSSYSRNAGKIFYHLELFDRNLNDGHEVRTSCTEYPGTERRKAIAAFQDYVKQHPGIVHEMHIEKSKWER